VEIADALCDLQYVLSGAILEFGFGGKFKSLFEEVHRSNMSKVVPQQRKPMPPLHIILKITKPQLILK
jgi:predicted HAD superfamily Cof-like phosphohydrolase